MKTTLQKYGCRKMKLPALLCALGMSLNALAHDPGLSTATARLKPGGIEVTLALAARDADRISRLDADDDGAITQSEFTAGKAALGNVVGAEFVVQANGAPIKPATVLAWLDTNNNDVHVTLSLPEKASSNLTFRAKFLSRRPPGHRQFFTCRTDDGRKLGEQLLSETDDHITIQAALAATASDGRPEQSQSFAGFFVLGVEHIVTGYDHLLFLFALLVATSRFASALQIITCFTLAHSLTLAVATLGTFTIPSRVVEPLIAASIVYVGIENLIRGDSPKGRWLLTFGFGLIHGFGFASVLRELGVGANGGGVTLPLLSFNLGVECGQIIIAAIALPLIWKLRQHPGFVRHYAPACSLLVTLIGGYWFIARIC